MKAIAFSIESLESRIAPATVLVFTDVDGDSVKVTSSAGDLNATGVATFDATGHQLQLLTLDASFKGANIKTVVTRSAAGDGLVNIGGITASGVDLGSVTVKGDLGEIFCGDGDKATGPGLKLLSVRSMGLHGTATQPAGGDLLSVIEGALGALKVATDMKGATVGARNFTEAADGKIGSVTIGGSVIGAGALRGGIFTTGDMPSVKIGRDLVGGLDGSSGQISCGGRIGSLTLGGSVVGGEGFFDGSIEASDIGSAKIGGDLRGGTNAATGAITCDGKIAKLTIGGSVIGGTGAEKFTSGSDPVMGQIIAKGDIGFLKIAHDVIGFSGAASGTIQSLGDVASLVIGGSLVGGGGDESGKIDVGGKLTKLTIGGSLVGGAGNQNTVTVASIVHEGQVFVVGDIGSVKVAADVLGGNGMATGEIRCIATLSSVAIGGSLVGGLGAAGGQLAATQLGTIKIGRDVIGGQGSFTGSIITAGTLASFTVVGSVLGGTGNSSGDIVVGGELGALKIGGDLVGGRISGTQGALDSTGYIQAGRIGSAFIGGSVTSGTDTSTGGNLTRNGSIRSNNDIGSLTVRGSLIGHGSGDPSDPDFTSVVISARGQASPGAIDDVAIGKIRIGGRVEFTDIMAGFDVALAVKNADAQIGPVTVGGDWISSNLLAGVQAAGDGFGNSSDVKIAGAGVKDGADLGGDGAISKISSVIIKGTAIGTAAAGDFLTFGIEAQLLGSIKIGSTLIPLTADAGNDLMTAGNMAGNARPLGATRGTTISDDFDFHAIEVPLT